MCDTGNNGRARGLGTKLRGIEYNWEKGTESKWKWSAEVAMMNVMISLHAIKRQTVQTSVHLSIAAMSAPFKVA